MANVICGLRPGPGFVGFGRIRCLVVGMSWCPRRTTGVWHVKKRPQVRSPNWRDFLREFSSPCFASTKCVSCSFVSIVVREFSRKFGREKGREKKNFTQKFTQKFTHEIHARKIHARNSRTKNSRTKFTHEIHAEIHAGKIRHVVISDKPSAGGAFRVN